MTSELSATLGHCDRKSVAQGRTVRRDTPAVRKKNNPLLKADVRGVRVHRERCRARPA